MGTLIQHIPDEIENGLSHSDTVSEISVGSEYDVSLGLHQITIIPNTKLHFIMQLLEIDVNTSHHQSIKTPGQGIIVSAYAPDGVVEAIECLDAKWCMGVQWHPEFLTSKQDENLIRSFVEACKG